VGYIRIFSDASGLSHFSNEYAELFSSDFAPPAPPLFLSTYFQTVQLAFLGAPSDWNGTWHPTPRRQFMIFLSGETEIEVSGGEKRKFVPGDVLLLEDTKGQGHYTRCISPVVVAIVQLSDG